MATYRVIGQSLPRIDGPSKLSGAALYSCDIHLPNMLHAKILHSPYANADIVSIDSSAALALPGVKAVISFKDSGALKENQQVYDLPVQAGAGWYLMADKARYVGDEVAAVAAISEDLAEEALKLIKVQYNVLPFVLTTDDAMKAGAPKVQDTGNIVKGQPTYTLNAGDTATGFKNTDKTYTLPDFYIEHVNSNPAQPYACTAFFDRDELTVWTSTQSASAIAMQVAPVLGIPTSHVRVIATNSGGGFGTHLQMCRAEGIAAILTQRTGQPVKLVYTRQEEINNIWTRKRGIATLKVGTKKDGTITAVDYNLIHDIGAYLWASHISGAGRGVYQGYTNPNTHYEGTEVYTNKQPGGGMRAWGKEYGTVAMQVIMDMIAEDLNMDPLDFRLKNLYNVGQAIDLTVAAPIVRNTCGVRDCITQGAQRIGWSQKRTPPSQKTGAVRSGIGFACHVRDGGASYSEAIVMVNKDQSVFVTAACPDPGTGARTVMNQIAAEVLGADFGDVAQSPVDSLDAPFGATASASAGMRSNGNAVKLAATDAKNKILALAAANMKVDVSTLDLSLRDNAVFVKTDPTKKITIATAFGSLSNVMGVGQGTPGSMVSAQAVFVEVDVDTETGEVFVKNLVAANDCGVAMNPAIIQSQMFGGNLMGVGIALKEGKLWDSATGFPLNTSYHQTGLPTFLDFGTIDTSILVQPDSGLEPYGASGPSEATPMSTKPAIMNAIYNAIGIRFFSIPVTPDQVLKALGKA